MSQKERLVRPGMSNTDRITFERAAKLRVKADDARNLIAEIGNIYAALGLDDKEDIDFPAMYLQLDRVCKMANGHTQRLLDKFTRQPEEANQ